MRRAILCSLILAGAAVGAFFARKAGLEEVEKDRMGDRAVGKIARVFTLEGAPAFELEGAAAVASWVAAVEESATEEEQATGEVVLAPGGTHEVRAPFAGVVGAGARELLLGSTVERGDKLATLAPAQFDLLLRQRQAESDREAARAEVAAAEHEVARTEALNKDGTVATRLVYEARYRIARARASLLEAERRAESLSQVAERRSFDETPILAPATGVVSQLAAPRGARVQAGDLLLSVDALDAALARVDLAPGLVSRESPPRRVTIVFPEGGASRAAELASVDPRVKPGTLFVSAFYRFEGTAPLPRAGEPVVARLPVGEPVVAARVPETALLVRDGGVWVYVHAPRENPQGSGGRGAPPDTFVRRAVTVLARRGHDALLRDGVRPGEQVVVTGAAVLLAEELKPLIEVEGGPPEAEPDASATKIEKP
jgi:RND family efflux transporter MFP subunit